MLFSLLAAVMLTPWGEQVTDDNAWREYPRPQMVRSNWMNLNGRWNYTIVSNALYDVVKVAEGTIRVPFAFESVLSGVGRKIEPHEKMIYERRVTLTRKPNRRVLLNFEAVDWRAQVFVNGVEAGLPHEGGNLPFSYDITELVNDGENALKVVVWDPTQTFIAAGGKQNDVTRGCFYTRVSGIWQTVWIEEVPKNYIVGYKVTPDIDKGEVKIEVEKIGEEGAVEVSVCEAGPRQKAKSTFNLQLPVAHLWSPEDPYLYNFTLRYGEDEVKGYFAMRKFSKCRDSRGAWRFKLNNEFYYPIGTLDQGWWPDGLLTPPSEAAMAHDITTLKKCGFNMMRKHIKVEPRRYYALCDRLGLLVFQDAPSPAGDRNIFDPVKNEQRYGMFRREWKAEMDHLFNVPSIVMWIPYNEGWGQPDPSQTAATLRWTRRYDPTRLVNGPSGWNDFEGGDRVMHAPKWRVVRDIGEEATDPSADVIDAHYYRGPGQCKHHQNRVSLLGEFGGLGHPVEGHLWADSDQAADYRRRVGEKKNSWGYGGIEDTKTREGLEKTYRGLYDKMLPMVGEGLSGSVYTQTTDVEIEINGIMTYDRRVLKFNPEVLKEIHRKICDENRSAAAK